MLSLVISVNNKTLYSGSGDNTIIAWDIAAGKRKATFVQMEKGMWLCYLPDGRFAGHPKAVQYLCYIDSTTKEVFPAEDLVERFYRPDEVAKALV
ncbi:MAG: hypothetical protein JXJ04_21725 [Spirochaetales bacterium]|nr:hypothetical protein [Spirochaetales bacterium]